MSGFDATLAAAGTPGFAATLAADLERRHADLRRLAAAASTTGYVEEQGLRTTLLGSGHDDGMLRVRLGLFFREVLAGCSCGDEPTTQEGYCELVLVIDADKGTGELRAAG